MSKVIPEYQCIKCGSISSGEDWNDKTREICGEDITEIESVNFEEYQLEYFCFNCPECEETCYVEDGHITKHR